MIYRLPKKLQGIWYAIFKWHYRKERIVKIRGFDLKLLPTVFHPSLYLSTEIFLDYILSLSLDTKKVLELGTGNGLISLYLSKYTNLEVHASDINAKAIDGIKFNAEKYSLSLSTYHSDLFASIPEISFDYIFINPPFYKKKITENSEYAFFAGDGMEYFHSLFAQLKSEHLKQSKVLFILSENAVVEEIKAIALEHSFSMKVEKEVVEKREVFYIYSLC